MTFWLCSSYFPFLIACEFWRLSSLPLWITSMGRKKLRCSIVTQARSRYVTQARPAGLSPSSPHFPGFHFWAEGGKERGTNGWKAFILTVFPGEFLLPDPRRTLFLTSELQPSPIFDLPNATPRFPLTWGTQRWFPLFAQSILTHRPLQSGHWWLSFLKLVSHNLHSSFPWWQSVQLVFTYVCALVWFLRVTSLFFCLSVSLSRT